MLTQEIQKKIGEAMKSGDRVRLETLKMLSAALHNAKINKGLNETLKEEEERHVVQKEAKKRQDAIEAYQHAVQSKQGVDKQRAQANLDREKQELLILEQYLPEQMSDQELSIIIDKAMALEGAGNIQDMGRVIGKTMELSQGRADGKRVASMVKEKLI